MTTYLDNWSLTTSDNPYIAPECKRERLQGNVSDHPNFDDGEFVKTSDILEVQGRAVRTRSRWYYLGDPDPKYVEWCKENGHHDPLTFDEPIRIKH